MLRPCKGNVLILPEKVGLTSEVIVIPEIAKDRDLPEFGRVIAIGGRPITKKKIVLEPEFKVGDRVMVKKFTGLFVDYSGVRYFQVKQHDVMAVLS